MATEITIDQISNAPGGAREIAPDEIRDAPAPSLAESARQILFNVPKSAVQFGRSIVQPIIDPVGTIEGLSRMARGGLGINEEERPAWEATKQFFSDRYGGWENVKKTIREDPVGFVADVSTLVSAGGSLAARAPGVAGKIGAAARTAGEAINPINVAGKVVAMPLKPVRQVLADVATESAYKLGTKIKMGKRDELIETIQANKILPTKRSVNRITEMVSDLKSTAENLELEAGLSGGTRINTADLLDRAIDPVIARWSKSDEASKFTGALKRYKDDVLKSHGGDISLSEAIDLKRRLQEQLRPVFAKELTINPGYRKQVVDQAKQALEVEVKAELERAIPGYADVNSEIHKLLKVQPFVETAANRIGQYNVVRMTDMLFGLGGWGVTHDPIKGLATAIAARVITDPVNVARLGNVLSPGSKSRALLPVGRAALGFRATGYLGGLNPPEVDR